MMQKTFWLATCCATALLMMGCKNEARDLVAKPATNLNVVQPIAYLEELKDVNIVTRFKHATEGFVEAPAIFLNNFDTKRIEQPALVQVRFTDDSVIGHADLEDPVRCLLIEINQENNHYGVYGLWKDKANLEMPMPSHESTITWDGVSSSAALVRVISEIGLSEERSREIVNAHQASWFAPGLRAILLTEVPVNASQLPTIYCFEQVSND